MGNILSLYGHLLLQQVTGPLQKLPFFPDPRIPPNGIAFSYMY